MAAWALVSLLVLAGCADEGDQPGETGRSTTASGPSATLSSGASDDTPAPTPSTQLMTTAEFCDRVRDVVGDEGAARAEAVLVLLQRGLPGDLDGEAKQGLQVLLDHAAELGSVRDSWRLYRDLDRGERADLRALVWWVTKSCGPGYLQDLLPELPEAPDWLTDPKIPGLG